MKSIRHTSSNERDSLLEEYAQQMLTVQRHHDTYASAASELNDAISDLNDIIQRMNDLAQDISDKIREYIEERSESWREGDRGQAYDEWANQWEYAGDIDTMDEVSESFLDEPDLSSFERAASEPQD